jgi:sulfur carrier protein
VELKVNGDKKNVGEHTTLSDLLESMDISADATGIAVALNESVVPRQNWRATRLRPSDSIEVIRAVQGG